MTGCIKTLCFALFLFLAACSGQPQQQQQQPSSHMPAEPVEAAQSQTPVTPQTPAAQPASTVNEAKPAAKSEAVKSEAVKSEAAPKLLVPVKKIDFGKQPKEKSLARSFVVKNVGNAALKIEAVEPS